MPPPDIFTFGCRLNAYESEIIRAHAQAAGLADAVIINSCAVTAEAERQLGQTIRKLRRERPDAKIIVTGCAAQIDPEKFAAMPEVDHVLGNAEKLKPESFVALNYPAPPRTRVGDIQTAHAVAPHQVQSFEGIYRAFVEAQNGCDHRCTFCIIPYGRGPSRSVPIGAIAQQTQSLVASGYNEIVFTGVDITAYGADLPGRPTLGQMLRRVLAFLPPNIQIRLSSLDPVEVDEDIWRLIADEPRLLPHLHLSVQSGDDLILKRMKRRHTAADVEKFCARARRLRPDIVFGADLIAGFPTETEAMFVRTQNLVEGCGFTWLHVFPYSARQGTPAAKMPQIKGEVRKARAAQLRALGAQAAQSHMQTLVGQTLNVLIEQPNIARTPSFAPVKLTASGPVGQILPAKILACVEDQLLAELSCNTLPENFLSRPSHSSV